MGKNYPFYNTTIGFEKLFDELTDFGSYSKSINAKQNAFPLHNIVKISDTVYDIELAVAGYSQEQLEVSYKDSVLTVETKDLDRDDKEYIHKGISSKNFHKQFMLADDIIVGSVNLKDGILKVGLLRIIPEEKKPKVFQIGSGDPQLLTESE